VRTWLRVLICAVVALVMIFPVYCMVVVSLTPKSQLFSSGSHLWPHGLTLANFTDLFDRFPLGAWFANSLAVAGLTTLLSVTVNLLAGYALAKVRFAGRSALFLLVLSTMMIPTQAIMIPQFRMVSGLHLYGTFWAVILPSASTALGIFLARQFMLSVPDELLEAARVDGANTVRTFWYVLLPLSRPIIAAILVLVFINSWNEFLLALLFLQTPDHQTITLVPQYFVGQYNNDQTKVLAAAVLTGLPVVIAYIALQRFFERGLAAGALK
jgi:multiple sugar transport system permease protein